MKQIVSFLIVGLALFTILVTTILAQEQNTDVTATPLSDQINIRATTSVDALQVGTLESGTTYAVIGQSELYPWLLLGDMSTRQPVGWVYETLVEVRGNLNTVPFSDQIVDPSQTQPTLLSPTTLSATPTTLAVESNPGSDPTDSSPAEIGITPISRIATSTPAATNTPVFTVAGTTQNQINLRYGPGTTYPRVGVAEANERFQITGYHTQLPWVQIRYDSSPTGFAWVLIDLLVIEGDIYTTNAIQQLQPQPTLSPTPSVVQSSSRLQDAPPVELSTEFQALGNQLWSIVLNAGFDPQTNKFGSLFLLDLQTGEAISFGSDIAYRGTSINKIPVLASLYGTLQGPPRERTAVDIANTMICSENSATNRLISLIGEGDEWRGAQNITGFLDQLELKTSYLLAPYTVDPDNPPLPPAPIPVPQTEADQEKASPEPYNQITVNDMGWLLASIYQCAYEESGPLLTNFPEGTYEPRECRQMIHVMANNTVDGLLKAGVPADTRVAHKHGWVNDTHTNAGIFFTDGGDYVLVMALHSEQVDATGQRYLAFNGESLPAFAEVSRAVYNYFNPDAPLSAIREGFIPEAPTCNFASDPLVADLQQFQWDR